MSAVEEPKSAISRIQAQAPAEQLARALMSVAHIADARDESATFDTVRIEVSDTGAMVVTARNPQTMAACIVPEADAISAGAVEITPATARELAKICRHKVSKDNPVEALLTHTADALELELLYGLPICTHRTRRPALSWRQKEGAVFAAIREVAVEVEEMHDAAMAAADGYGDEAGPGFADTAVEMTPTQASELMKAAASLGEVLRLEATEIGGRFFARAGDFAAVWVCRRDDADENDGEDDGDGTPPGPIVDGATGDVESHGQESSPALRVVSAKPIGGLS
ncbi:hypothetical protein ACFORJ_07945 [Corynebacterium hansenii]|uniref:Uncharacterized protein n=1 Tax=Corynebacterium hansenii TaxID=394964 RepID=A0ABV7ZRS1_9CORY|nr:hypothetical protein [Corynebacterium hansenii]WJZ00683.1 hypothetical protein CHAN_10410 [Corynebacterium hansenii]